jgi:hypothetical protein
MDPIKKEDAKAKDEINKVLNKHELENRRDLAKDKNTKNVHLYPHLDDAGFNRQIAKKREFYDTQYDGAIVDIVQRSNELANASFELSPHQIFVQNFLSMYTPYNSLLLYHGLGSGKTCSAIGVCEERRTYMRHMNTPLSKMYVVASPSVQDNFQLQLFDRSKLRVDKNGNCTYDGCVGNNLIEEINPGGVPFTGSSVSEIKDHVEKEILKIIRASYAFMGYEKFSNLIESKADSNANFFNNRLVVIDEIHNIRKQNSTISANLLHMLQMSKNTQLLLLTATPMFNHYTEIVWLINLLNVNDGRGILSIGDVFQDNGEFKKGGKELLVRKMTGYVSYVRGENPYSFPFRIYPNVFAPTHTFPDVPYPRLKPTGAVLNHGILHLKPYLTVLGDHQMRTYRRLVDQAFVKKTPLYSIYNISKCIQCSIIAYPERKTVMQDADSDSDEELESESEDAGKTVFDVSLDSATKAEPKAEKAEPKAEKAEPTIEFDLKKHMDADLDEDPFKETLDQEFVDKYVAPLNKMRATAEITNIGESGLKSVMNYTRSSTELGNFDYKPGQPHIFEMKHLETYSSKIYAISRMLDAKDKGKDGVDKQSVEGIVLIYSKYIFAGIIPMALALEELGFTNASSRGNLMAKKASRKSNGLKYAMITGTPLLTPDFKIIKKINHADNINGDKIKVVLISDSGSEGIDLQMIRQIHVLDPWFNLNRTEQIIGRGVRNFSHRRLPFEKRNVQIFLHAAILSDRDEEESMDLYQYRLSEKKAIQIGKISRIVKQHSVDCMLNHAQTNFTADNFADQAVDIQLSDHAIIKNFRFGDQPFSASCDYLPRCDYDCLPKHNEIKDDEINDTTYNIYFSGTNIEKIVKIIKLLMTDRFFYKKKDLVAFINKGSHGKTKFPLHLIDLALSSILTDKTPITDKYGRTGTLINIGDYYLFQPDAINVANLSVQNRIMKLNVNYNVIPFDDLTKDKNKDVKVAALATAAVAKSATAIKVDATQNLADDLKGRTILMDMFREYERILAFSEMETVASASQPTAKSFGEVIRFLNNQNKTETSTWMKLATHHLFDVSSVANKLDLMNFIQDPNNLEKIEYDIRDRLRESLFYADLTRYIRSKVFPYRKKNYMYLITDPILKKDQIEQIPGTFYQETLTEGWEAMPDTLHTELAASRNKHFRIDVASRTVDDRLLAQKIGFIGFHNDKSNIVFKIKNLEKIKKHTPQQTLKGTNCFQATPQDIMRNLQWLADASDAALYAADAIEKQPKEWLCILLELSFRRLNELHVKNKVWFVDTAEAVEFRF